MKLRQDVSHAATHPGLEGLRKVVSDLLEAEHFVLTTEPSVDTSGMDIEAIEEYRSHNPTRTVKLRWRVQCKHYALSGKKLDRAEIETILGAFEAVRGSSDGLLIMTSTDYTEPAKRVWDTYAVNHRDARVQVWNGRQIVAKLDRHPSIAQRYGLAIGEDDDRRAIFTELSHFLPCKVLVISDQSPLAHDIAEALANVGFDVDSLPVWNYLNNARLNMFIGPILESAPRLVVIHFGDTFGYPVPERLRDTIHSLYAAGSAILFFPFLAWMIAHDRGDDFESLCPARLISSDKHITAADARKIIGEYRAGDFTFMLDADRFAEDQYVELEPSAAQSDFAVDLTRRFGFAHTFEFLRAASGATVGWADTSENPFIVTSYDAGRKAAYVNTCSHTCLSLTRQRSPFESSKDIATVLRNVIRWLLSAS